MIYRWEAHNENQQKAFLTDTRITSDYFTYYRMTRFNWACELGLETSRIRPKVLFNDPPFEVIRKSDYSIDVDLEQWSLFISKVASIFRSNTELSKEITRRAFTHLTQYDAELTYAHEDYLEHGIIRKKPFHRLMEQYTIVNCYSVFNLAIPIDFYIQILAKYEIESPDENVDLLLVPSTISDRIILRSEYLKQSLAFSQTGRYNYDSLLRVLSYTHFDKWLFNDDLLCSQTQIEREIKALSSLYKTDDLFTERISYYKAHQNAYIRRHNLISKLISCAASTSNLDTAKQLCTNAAFLSAAVSIEELRHQIECRYFLLLGKMLRQMKLDVAHSSLKDIFSALEHHGTN